MKQIKYFCDCCKKEKKKETMLTMNIFPKVRGQRTSLGSKDICRACYKKFFGVN